MGAKNKASKFHGNHVTKNTQTFVGRVPKGVHKALHEQAHAEGVRASDIHRKALALGLAKLGWELTPETKALSGL
jgi:hypothetical protein